jgi:hypothetical protein
MDPSMTEGPASPGRLLRLLRPPARLPDPTHSTVDRPTKRKKKKKKKGKQLPERLLALSAFFFAFPHSHEIQFMSHETNRVQIGILTTSEAISFSHTLPTPPPDLT